MWDFYDRLIDLVPKDLTVDRITVGDTWTFVAAEDLRGIAVTVNEQERILPSFSKYRGVSLKEVAALCKSWNFVEASVGTAALNAYLNTRNRLKEVGAEETIGGFHDYKKIAAGKKVAIIGHFFQLERFLTESSVYVLERSPEPGDYPDPACEYLLPEMDYTFITGFLHQQDLAPASPALPSSHHSRPQHPHVRSAFFLRGERTERSLPSQDLTGR